MNGQPDPTNFAPPAGDIPVDFLERLASRWAMDALGDPARSGSG